MDILLCPTHLFSIFDDLYVSNGIATNQPVELVEVAEIAVRPFAGCTGRYMLGFVMTDVTAMMGL